MSHEGIVFYDGRIYRKSDVGPGRGEPDVVKR